MSDLLSAGIQQSRGGDSADCVSIAKPRYRGAFEHPNTQIYRSLVREQAISYQVSCKFIRLHANPPLWNDFHPHEFIVSIQLVSIVQPEDMYGCDLIEAEKMLEAIVDSIPTKINDLIPSGTIEAIAIYIRDRWQLPDPEVKFVNISVGENSNRVVTIW